MATGVVPARGRPVLRCELAARSAVLALLASVGPGAGRAVLAGQFPELPRAELADLLRRYRSVWVRRHDQLLHMLHWQHLGTVWAIDYARPPLPLEEGYSDLLAVRDLASGLQVDHPASAAGAATESGRPGRQAAPSPHSAAAWGTNRAGAESNREAPDRAAGQRQAISRALVAHGYLLLTRRRIPLPIKRKKVT
jgi:hypothetical protein